MDAYVGGVGGSPFAGGATGEVGTEGLVRLLADIGVHNGRDLEQLVEAMRIAR